MMDVRELESAGGAADWDSPRRAISACTLPEALIWARGVLVAAEVDSPRLDAELLLAHMLGWQRAQLYTHAEHMLQPQQAARYGDLIARRAQREPLAYVIGHHEFYGLDLFVDRRVLIPRPETEVLVDQAISQGNQLLDRADHLMIADVGTGCGAIAIALALSLSPAEVYAIDLSAPALEAAAWNRRHHNLEAQVHLLQGDLLAPLPKPVGLIVANLPYIASREVAALPPEISCYEPRRAWHGGAEGLELIERLLAQAGQYLEDAGSILLEIGSSQGPGVQDMATCHFPTAVVDILQDGAGLDRVVRIADVGRRTGAKGGQ
jgi:release factor glutamine methyltransferase